jgi:hypothetical protein
MTVDFTASIGPFTTAPRAVDPAIAARISVTSVRLNVEAATFIRPRLSISTCLQSRFVLIIIRNFPFGFPNS